jgi:hypothetical protein
VFPYNEVDYRTGQTGLLYLSKALLPS